MRRLALISFSILIISICNATNINLTIDDLVVFFPDSDNYQRIKVITNEGVTTGYFTFLNALGDYGEFCVIGNCPSPNTYNCDYCLDVSKYSFRFNVYADIGTDKAKKWSVPCSKL